VRVDALRANARAPRRRVGVAPRDELAVPPRGEDVLAVDDDARDRAAVAAVDAAV
jgi:hypothetical protein